MPRIRFSKVKMGERTSRLKHCFATAKGPLTPQDLIAAVYLGDPPPGAIGSIRNAISELRSSGSPIYFRKGVGYILYRGRS